MVKTAPELMVNASPAVLAAESNVCDVLIVAMTYPFKTISILLSLSTITISSGALLSDNLIVITVSADKS
jgi:hypothetical protein